MAHCHDLPDMLSLMTFSSLIEADHDLALTSAAVGIATGTKFEFCRAWNGGGGLEKSMEST